MSVAPKREDAHTFTLSFLAQELLLTDLSVRRLPPIPECVQLAVDESRVVDPRACAFIIL